MINTVTGKIKKSELGRVLMHEHVICTSHEFQNFPGWLDRSIIVPVAVEKIKYVSENFGIKTIIDATPQILGRNLDLLKEISEKSGVQIIASTGFYFYQSFSQTRVKPETIAAFMLEEIKNGKIRPGFLKCAVDFTGITKNVEFALQTMAIVQKESSLPLYMHSNAATRSGIPAVKLLSEAGVPIEKIIVGHVSDNNDLSYALELLSSGVNIAVDRINNNNPKYIYNIINEGFEDRIFMSHDHICCYDRIMEGTYQGEPHGLDIVPGKYFSELLHMGVSIEILEKIITKNVEKLFTI